MPRSVAPLAAGLLALITLGGCAGVPSPPAGLWEVIDLGEAPIPQGPAAARRHLTAGDEAWGRRTEPEQAATARAHYWRAAVADPGLYEAYWKAARAGVRVGLAAEGSAARAAEFERGAGIARLAIDLDPDRPEAHYQYTVNLGLLARERQSIGLDSIREMIPHLERAAEIDPDLDEAGPFRTLALVYLRAPGWPASVGDDEAGLEQIRRAVERVPRSAANQLVLAEALFANGEKEEARAALDRAVDLALLGPEADQALLLEEARSLRQKLR